MHLIGVVLAALTMASCEMVVEKFNRCAKGDSCIDIRLCDWFGPHHTSPTKWPASLKEDFRARFCKRESYDEFKVYKVCCPPTGRQLHHLNLKDCGRRYEYHGSIWVMSRGTNSDLFEFPWVALLRRHTGEWICSGTVINERYVLTVAHCVWMRDIKYVRLGEYDLEYPIDCLPDECAPEPQDIPVQSYIFHEDYKPTSKINDIALLRLVKTITMNNSKYRKV
ncbi:AGAP009214-PA-like protein [Anopheles sinensis]|uniref:AGAP009214-PA-like protein n=1 Tax=Anopheles sinensis TaxID=74873 RepID=A0A084W6P2_ANOSI|nr:AGAP009214-PA-like protein [Anopheles sinensis]